MRAVSYSRYGGPDVLEVVDVPEPHAGPGQIRVRTQATAVNGFDWKQRSGMFAGGEDLAEPKIPGTEVAGTVDEVGDGVDGVAVGDDVFGPASSGAAEFAVLSHWARKPLALSYEEASGLAAASEVAVRVLTGLGAGPGARRLINAATGGVGVAAIQLAQARGVELIVGTASEANHPFLVNLGVRPTTYGPGLAERVAQIAPEGITIAFDAGGRGVLPDLVELTGSPSRVITIADYEGAEETGVSFSGSPSAWTALDEVAELVEQGRFSMPVTGSYRFAEAAEAHRVSEAGHVRGKLVLVP